MVIESLLSRPVSKVPDRVRFDGRVLFLATDAALVRRQLAGEDLPYPASDQPLSLRDNISTDEITPAYICYYFDETLGEFPYLGLKCGEEFPVARGLVKQGGFAVSVSGKRRGKGSSREQSPYAEMMAGIKLVIAENIERIYRENCQNLGVFASTDFGAHRARAARRGDPAHRVHEGRGRDHARDHRVRRALQLQRGAAAGEGRRSLRSRLAQGR